MKTDNPENDYQTHMENQTEDLRECGNCEEMVPADEITKDTDYLGESCGCRKATNCTELAHANNNRNAQYGKVWVSHVVLFMALRIRDIADYLNRSKPKTTIINR